MNQMSENITATILVELNKAVKAFSLYPQDHPSLKSLLDISFQSVKKSLENSDDITVSIEKRSFYEKGREILKGANAAELAEEFFLRRIKKLTFSSETSSKDWIILTKLLNLSPQNLGALGGTEKFAIQEGMRGIWLNEIKYEDIVNKAQEEESEEAAEIAEATDELEMLPEEEFEDESESDSLPEELGESETVKENEDDLDNLLILLEQEKDDTKYQEILEKLVYRGIHLKNNERMDDLLKILYIFSVHSQPESKRTLEQKESSIKGIKTLVDIKTLKFLIESFCVEKNETKHRQLVTVILSMGPKVVPFLLDRLKLSEERHVRRNLFDLILLFGETAREHIETRLVKDEWFNVRQMVSLLGYIKSPKSFEALRNCLNYPDIRVKKEVIKTLAKLRTADSIRELMKTFFSEEHSLSLQAILSLGAIKETSAVPALLQLLKKKDFWGKYHEIKSETLKALGNIGDTKALPDLFDLIKKKGFWRKKQCEELRALAALSLGKIGGDGVVSLLKETMETSQGIVRQSCQRAIEELEAH
jgi:HEAT repeat protein